jgi:uncharacterized Zn finger protein (UPF0148 family)
MVQPGHVYCPECGKAMYEPGDHSCEEELLQSRIARLTAEIAEARGLHAAADNKCMELFLRNAGLQDELAEAREQRDEAYELLDATWSGPLTNRMKKLREKIRAAIDAGEEE